VKKVCKKKPVTPSHLMARRMKEKRELRYSLEYIHEKQIRLLYLDEAVFTARNFPDRCWSQVGQNIQVDF
jgi:hypothetical protein